MLSVPSEASTVISYELSEFVSVGFSKSGFVLNVIAPDVEIESFSASLQRSIEYINEIRESLGYPKQPKIVRHFAKVVLLIRAYTIKLFFPIRLLSQAVLRTPNKVGDKPRF